MKLAMNGLRILYALIFSLNDSDSNSEIVVPIIDFMLIFEPI
jgi:hypothetical protein